METMTTSSINYFITGMVVRVMPLFAILILVAIILFVIWMAKFAKKEDLKKWIIWFLVIGFVGWILSMLLIALDQYLHDSGMMNNEVEMIEIEYPEQMMNEEFVPEMMEINAER